MNKRLIPIFIAVTALFASCTGEDSSSDSRDIQSEGLNCKAAPIEYAEEGSRSSLSLGSSGMLFTWDEGDRLSIFYSESDQTASIYTLHHFNKDAEGNVNKSFANFKSEGFKLTSGKRYYAISTTEADAPEGVRLPDKRNIQLTYAGQVQKGNKTTAHLGAYDYMAASGIAEGDDHVALDFQHLGATVRVIMDQLPTDVEFTKMEMYDTENSFLQPNRTFDMTKGLAADGTYVPALDPVDITSADYKTSDRFSLELEGDETDHGMKANVNVSEGKGRLDLFIQVPPAKLTGKDLIFMVYGKDGSAYYIQCAGRELKAGKAYQMKGNAQITTTYTVKIKVNHEWQLGSTLDSRGTGDPGLDDKFPYPTNIYYVLCVGNKVKAVNEKSCTEIEGISEGDWSRSADNAISTYAQQLTFAFTDEEKDKTKNLYIVASNDDLSSSFSSISTSTTEEQVQNLVYSISGTDKQSFMKNLYSTPYKSGEAFIGNLGKDYFKDIILYHVAAKVDLKWNSTSVLSGNVSVNNVKDSDLYLFKPTENSGNVISSGGYTATSTIEDDRMFNGRQVFYLPQFTTCKYNVSVGENTDDVTFNPSTANGFTSWLRWLKKY